MAYKIKQENYNKRPTAEQRKVIYAIGGTATIDIDPAGNTIPMRTMTRIEAHLYIKTQLRNDAKKALYQTWKANRMRRRAERTAPRVLTNPSNEFVQMLEEEI